MQQRVAYVIVHIQISNPLILLGIVFQGTVLGRRWNICYVGARRLVRKKLFTETIFADDLNCYEVCTCNIGDAYIKKDIKLCKKSQSMGKSEPVAI